MSKHDLVALEEQYKQTEAALQDLGDTRDFEQLPVFIHRPGFTTPAEFLLIRESLVSMEAQAVALSGLKEALMTASRQMVGAAEVAPAIR